MGLFKKIVSGISALTLGLSIIPLTADAAAINPNVPATNNITLVKLEYQNVATPEIENTGLPVNLPTEVKPYDRTKYGDVEFSIYKLNKAQLPSGSAPMAIAEAVQTAALASSPLPYGAVRQGAPIAVDNDGRAVFSNVPSNNDDVYVIVETKMPARVITRAKPMLLQLPITNAQGTGYLTDVTLYPKNEIRPVEVEFIKFGETYDGTSVLPGALFHLYMGEAGSGEVITDESGKPVQYISDTNGEIKISDVPPGKYYLVEQQTNVIDGMVEVATPYIARGFSYLAGKEALNDQYNLLGFEVLPSGEVTYQHIFDETPAGFPHGYFNYRVPQFFKEVVNPYIDGRGRMADASTPSFDRFEDIEFRITLDVPANIEDYSDFSFEDILTYEGQPSDVLRFNDDITVTVIDYPSGMETDVVLEPGVDYVLTKDGNNKIHIQFAVNGKVSDKIINIAPGWDYRLLVKYTAEFYGDNILSGEIYENTANFSYNNSPNGNTETRYDSSSTEFTTYNMYLKKTDDGLWSSGVVRTGLEGAQFMLLRNAYDEFDSEGEQQYETQYFAGIDSSGNPIWKNTGIEFIDAYDPDISPEILAGIKEDMLLNHPDGLFTSDSNGLVEIKSFRAQRRVEYFVTEVKAPAGYRLPTEQSVIPIYRANEDIEQSGFNTPETAQEIVNFRAPDMPITGSEKTALVIMSLSALLFAGVIIGRKTLKKRV